jgi:exodeoxyribonuclease (lambda-induced)
MIIHHIEQRSEAWHDIRLGKFTGTRIGSLLSAKTTAKYQDAIFNVVSEIITGNADEQKITDDMQTGIDLEPYAIKEYESIFDVGVKEIGFVQPENKFKEWVGISPDGFINSDGMIEIKCPKSKTHLKYIEQNKLPSIYKSQVQSQLWICEKEYCDFMSYVPEMKPFIIRVFPDLEYIEKLKSELIIAIDKVKYYLDNYNKYNYLQ